MTEPYSQDLRNRHEHRNRERAAQLLPLNQTFRLVHAPQSIEYPTVVVLYVSFSYPVVSVKRSISFKLNQMSPVVVLVHVARLSKCKVDVVRSLCPWAASVDFPSVRLAADSRVPELAEFPYQSHQAAA